MKARHFCFYLACSFQWPLVVTGSRYLGLSYMAPMERYVTNAVQNLAITDETPERSVWHSAFR